MKEQYLEREAKCRSSSVDFSVRTYIEPLKTPINVRG